MDTPAIHSQRLLMRAMQPNDAETILAYRSDVEANRYQSWHPKTLEEVHQFIQKLSPMNVADSWHQLVIVRKEDALVIGDIGIHFMEEGNPQVELGYTLDNAYWGQAYATEALLAVIEYLFVTLHKHRITASIDPQNEKSIQLIKRLVFRQEAHFVQSLWIDGQWTDDLVYALLHNE